MGIDYVNLKEFTQSETDLIKQKSENDFNKVLRRFPNAKLIVTAKKMKKAGDRCKYSVHLKIEEGTSLLFTANHADWELGAVMNEVLGKMKFESEKIFSKGN